MSYYSYLPLFAAIQKTDVDSDIGNFKVATHTHGFLDAQHTLPPLPPHTRTPRGCADAAQEWSIIHRSLAY